jgi:hypothetical protein
VFDGWIVTGQGRVVVQIGYQNPTRLCIGASIAKPIAIGAGKVGFAQALPTLPDLIRRSLAVDAAHAEVFDFEEFLDAVF